MHFKYRETTAAHGRPSNPDRVLSWRGVAIVKSQEGRYVVDGILLFKGNSAIVETRLSKIFAGCNGSRWVGERR